MHTRHTHQQKQQVLGLTSVDNDGDNMYQAGSAKAQWATSHCASCIYVVCRCTPSLHVVCSPAGKARRGHLSLLPKPQWKLHTLQAHLDLEAFAKRLHRMLRLPT